MPAMPRTTKADCVKLAVIGGGSTYTPELVDGLAGPDSGLDVDELVLCDPACIIARCLGLLLQCQQHLNTFKVKT